MIDYPNFDGKVINDPKNQFSHLNNKGNYANEAKNRLTRPLVCLSIPVHISHG